jgi:hypothetical protein
VTLHSDHVAGGAVVLAGVLLLAVSGDLPFGTLSSPGAGMLPKLAIGFMLAFGGILLLRAGASPPFARIAWSDLPHAVRVTAAAAVAATLYTWLGFLLTIGALLLVLTYVVERRPLPMAAAFSVGSTLAAYLLFNTLLKSPLPRGVLGF